jgi:3-hydroxy-9,10-secoandrosta-1,3,5(10)-triene-9,17-dione monooxygenase reductase component
MGATLLDRHRISSDLVRQALGHFATGVTVVTSRGSDGAPVGSTASAVGSLSLVPPLLLVCLDRTSQTLTAIREHQAFAINVLADSQEALSANFARCGPAASWDDVGHRPGPTGSPHLHDTVAVLDCRLERCVNGGDHEIVIGRLVALVRGDQGLRPLLHYQGSYASLRAG